MRPTVKIEGKIEGWWTNVGLCVCRSAVVKIIIVTSSKNYNSNKFDVLR